MVVVVNEPHIPIFYFFRTGRRVIFSINIIDKQKLSKRGLQNNTTYQLRRIIG